MGKATFLIVLFSFIIGLILGYVYRMNQVPDRSDPVPDQVTTQTIKGKENIKTIKGQEEYKETVKHYGEKKYKTPAIIRDNGTKEYLYKDSTDLYTMLMNIRVHKDSDTIDIVKTIDVKQVERMRTDTLLVTRVDTLERTKYIVEKPSFFEGRTFGFIAGGATVAIITVILKGILH